jgi:hypothetical protein
MAVLEPVHWQVITPQMRELLRFIPWAQVREFFIDQAQALGQIWFGDEKT